MEHLKEILAGVGAFLIALAMICGFTLVGHENNQKVREMTRTCIAQDYRGWDDTRGCF